MKTHDHNGDAAHKSAMFAGRQALLRELRQIEEKSRQVAAAEASEGILCPRCGKLGGRRRRERKTEWRLHCVICDFLWRRKKTKPDDRPDDRRQE